jgi:hypothetical protein
MVRFMVADGNEPVAPAYFPVPPLIVTDPTPLPEAGSEDWFSAVTRAWHGILRVPVMVLPLP